MAAQTLRVSPPVSPYRLFHQLFLSRSSLIWALDTPPLPPFLTLSSHPSHLAASPADETLLISPDLLISPLMSGVTGDRQGD